MTQAPERIWAIQGIMTGETMWWPDGYAGGVEYVRADLCPDAATVRAEALREAAATAGALLPENGAGQPCDATDRLIDATRRECVDSILALIDTPAQKAPAPVSPQEADTVTLNLLPPECAPKGVPVLIAGGIAMKKTGGQWFSGMCEPAFSRELNWEPNWWTPIPQDNRALAEQEKTDE